jgi:hypothetical protein
LNQNAAPKALEVMGLWMAMAEGADSAVANRQSKDYHRTGIGTWWPEYSGRLLTVREQAS